MLMYLTGEQACVAFHDSLNVVTSKENKSVSSQHEKFWQQTRSAESRAPQKHWLLHCPIQKYQHGTDIRVHTHRVVQTFWMISLVSALLYFYRYLQPNFRQIIKFILVFPIADIYWDAIHNSKLNIISLLPTWLFIYIRGYFKNPKQHSTLHQLVLNFHFCW